MKFRLAILLVILYYVITPSLAQLSKTSGDIIGVYKWFENYPSATVLTFDDFSPGHPAIGIPDLISRNLTGTFFVTTGNAWRANDYSIMMNAVTKGVEIGNHTLSHPHLPTLNAINLNNEINSAYSTLNQNVTNQTVSTFAYPFGEYDNNVLSVIKKNHIAARTVYGPNGGRWKYNFASTENDYFTIPTSAVNNSVTKNAFAQKIQDGINDGGMVTFMFHSIYNSTVSDSWFDAIDQKRYNDFLDTLEYYSDKTWITTFSNAVKYHKEANSSTIAVSSNTITETIITLTDTIANNNIFNHPLSVYYKPVAKSFYTAVTQNGINLSFTQDQGFVYFNAIPDGGDITLIKDPAQSVDPATSISGSNDAITNASIYPVPNHGKANLKFTVKANDHYSWKIINTKGLVILSSQPKVANENDTIEIEIIVPTKGLYLVELQINNHKKTLKLIVE